MQTFCAVGNLVISQLGNDGWSVERKPNYLHTPTNPPIHQPMHCHAISYYIILHHSISAHAMIFNTIPSHTIFPSTNTALTIWVLSSCTLCSVLLLVFIVHCAHNGVVWCALHNCCTHCWWPDVHFAQCAAASWSGISIIGFWSGPASLCATQSALETQIMQSTAK